MTSPEPSDPQPHGADDDARDAARRAAPGGPDGAPDDGPDDGEGERLVAAAVAGDADALEQLLQRHLPALRAYIRLRAGPTVRAREDVSDLAQSVCRDVLQNLDRFEYGGEAGFRAWMFRTAMRVILDKHAFHKAQRRDLGREARERDDRESQLVDAYACLSTPSLAVVGRETLERLERAFDELDEAHREVIMLTRVAGLSHAEVAQAMGRTPGATRVLLHRALARLASLLDRDER